MTIFPFDNDAFSYMQNWTRKRITQTPNPHYGARSASDLETDLKGSISLNGHGEKEAFRRFEEIIIPSIRAQNHPTNVAYVPASPSPASLGFDSVLGAAEIFAGTWEAGSGAIHAENQALKWLATCAGFPESAGGVFVSGGTVGNLSALHAARDKRAKTLKNRPQRWAMLASEEAHSSIQAVANIMDVDLVKIATDSQGRIDISALKTTLKSNSERFFALISNAGATNSGAIDDLQALSKIAQEYGLWLHIDGAFGLAAIANEDARKHFKGLEKADSFIVDPHKWLFAPYDCCALLYRTPSDAAAAHSQSAVYLDPIQNDHWNPTDYAVHLSRRARGLPLWYSLTSYGTKAYSNAIAASLKAAQEIADAIEASPHLELILRSQLSIILFRPKTMSDEDIDEWAEHNRARGTILCMPTKWQGQKLLRICIVNPETNCTTIMNALKDLK